MVSAGGASGSRVHASREIERPSTVRSATSCLRQLSGVWPVQRLNARKNAARLGSVAEQTGPVARWVRDRVLMPLANRLVTEKTTGRLLQEPTERLVAIGRA